MIIANGLLFIGIGALFVALNKLPAKRGKEVPMTAQKKTKVIMYVLLVAVVLWFTFTFIKGVNVMVETANAATQTAARSFEFLDELAVK